MTTGSDSSPQRAALDRRTLLRSGAGLAALAALDACGGSRRASLPPPAGGRTAGSPSASAAPPSWSRLRDRLAGRLVRPGDPGYSRAVQLFDPRFDSVHPRGVVYCANAADVARGIGFARAAGLPLAVRSGGHSYAGYSTGPGLVLDVSPMASVHAGSGGRAVLGAGAQLVDVYAALNARGRSIPAGSCPTVGIAGLALGGGMGVVGRAHGLTCDQLASVTLVTADGVVRTVDAADPTGLFWACQGGGGGNFGVVTSFTVETFPTAPVTLFTLRWPWAAADQVLPAWQSWAPSGPDPLWSNCLLLAHPDPDTGEPLLQVGGVWSGTPAGLAPMLSSLARGAGSAPRSRYVAAVPFDQAMLAEAGCAGRSVAACHLAPGGSLPRMPSLARSDYLTEVLPPAGVAALVAGVSERQRSTGGQGGVGYDAAGGAINRVASAATAFVHRDTLCSAQYTASFTPATSPAQLAADGSWLDALYASQRPYVSGQAYQNYIDPTLPDWAGAYYGANLPRLQTVKARYDPADVFHFAQSIPLPGS